MRMTKVGLFITFSINHGTDTRTYYYPPGPAQAIYRGADPASYPGEEVSSTEAAVAQAADIATDML